MKRKRLIVNADDLGLSRGITDGIMQAHREGIVTSASLMVNQPATDYALEKLRYAPELGIGIHLNLCQGTPVLPPSEVPSLVTTEAKFHPPAQIVRKLWRWQVSSREIEAELRAQIRRMKDYGLTPTHADSHHHLHLYPCAVGPFRRAVLAEGIRRARAPRKSYWGGNGRMGGPHVGPLYRRLLVEAYMKLLQSFAFRNLALPDSGVAFHPRYKGKLNLLEEVWSSTLENIPSGVYEIWCHPGFVQKGFSETDGMREQRELEVRILTSPQLRSLISRMDIELISYDQL